MKQLKKGVLYGINVSGRVFCGLFVRSYLDESCRHDERMIYVFQDMNGKISEFPEDYIAAGTVDDIAQIEKARNAGVTYRRPPRPPARPRVSSNSYSAYQMLQAFEEKDDEDPWGVIAF